jgi:hypothetical protein
VCGGSLERPGNVRRLGRRAIGECLGARGVTVVVLGGRDLLELVEDGNCSDVDSSNGYSQIMLPTQSSVAEYSTKKSVEVEPFDLHVLAVFAFFFFLFFLLFNHFFFQI